MPSSWKNKNMSKWDLIDHHTAGIFHTRISLESVCLTLSMGTVPDHTGSVGWTIHKSLILTVSTLQSDEELSSEAAGGHREQPGVAPRVAHLELCHPTHLCSKVLQLTAVLCPFNLLLIQICARGWACLQNTRPIKDLGFGQKPSPGQLRGHL